MSHRLARRDRAVAQGVLAAAVIGVAGLSAMVWGHHGPLHMDAVLLPHLTQPVVSRHLSAVHLARLDGAGALRTLVWFGSPAGIMVTLGVLVVASLAWRDRAGAVLAIAAPLLAEVVTEGVLKPLIGRTGPGGLDNFPSGHTTFVTAAALVALVLVDRHLGRRSIWLALPIALIWVGAVGLALVQVRAHYSTDVAGGLGVGVVVVVALVLLEDRLARRVRRSGR